jgi:hypothetical protein
MILNHGDTEARSYKESKPISCETSVPPRLRGEQIVKSIFGETSKNLEPQTSNFKLYLPIVAGNTLLV